MKNSVAIKIASIILAGTMAISMVACSNDADNDVDADSDKNETTVNEDKDEATEDEATENDTQTETNKESATDNGNDSEQVTESAESKLKDYVLNNVEYNNIIKQCANVDRTNHETFYQLDPHPYGFLESKGHDIQAIKNGTVKCETMSYIVKENPNSLFIATRVHEDGIATHYHLEYRLNDADMEFYKKATGTNYIQAAFTNDAVSRLEGQPDNETCIKISTADTKGLDTALNCSRDLGSAYVAAYIIGADTENDTFDCVVLPKFNHKYHQEMPSYFRIGTVESRGAFSSKNGVYDLPSASTGLKRWVEYEDKAINVYEIQEYDWDAVYDLRKTG